MSYCSVLLPDCTTQMLFVLMYVAYALFSYFLEINMDGSSGDLTKDGIANDLE